MSLSNAQVLSQVGAVDNRTPAEIAAGVTPVNYAYEPRVEIDGARHGFIGDDATNNDAAWTATRAVLVSLGGGILRLAPGTYRFTSQISLPINSIIEGCGSANTVLKCTANITAVLVSSSSARNSLRSLTLQGNAKTGTGIQIGDTNFTGVHRFQDLYVQGFAVGVRLAAALWTQFENVYITLNTVGVDFNAGGGAVYSTTVSFLRCVIDNNDLQGIKASFVPVNNSVIGLYHCTVQENCKSNTALPQMRFSDATGGARGLVLDNLYGESATVGIDFCDLANCNSWRVTNGYVNGAKDAFKDSIGGSCSQGLIALNQAVALTGKFVNIATAIDVCEMQNSFAGSITLTGVGCRSLSGNGIASWGALTTPFVPTMKGAGTAGAPTYTLQSGLYSKVGNIVCFEVRVSISAKGGMVGGISLEGLPLAKVTDVGVPAIFAAHMDGITVSGGNTAFHVELPSGSTSLQLFQSGSAAAAQIIDTALAAATTIIVSGSYQTTT